MNPDSQEPSFDYDVFISYSRRDIVFALTLEKALEDYSPHGDLAVPQRHLVVFRDEEDLTGVEYNRSIREHLENSAKMLVICSPHARASDFVSDEIRYFAEKRGGQNIIPVFLSGIPNNEAKKPEHEGLKAFPRCLREAMETPLAAKPSETMPLAADFIDLDPAKDKLYKGVFKGPWYTVLANIYGVPRSDIEQRDRMRKAQQRRIRAMLVAGIITVLSGALIVALIQENRAEKVRIDAEGLVEFMVYELKDKLQPIGRLDLLDTVNKRVNEYYKSLDTQKLSTETLRRKSAVLDNSGAVLLLQGQLDDALSAFKASKAISERLSAKDPLNTQWARDLSVSYNQVGDVLVAKGRLDDALAAFTAGKDIAEKLVAKDPTNTGWQRGLAFALWREANIAFSQGQKNDAAAAMDRAANIYARLFETLNTPEARTDSAKAWGFFAWYLLFDNQPQEAVEAALRGLEADSSQIWINTNLAHGHLFCGRYAEAEQIYRNNCALELSDGRRFDQTVLDDFKEMRDKGMAHPDMDRIEKVLVSRR